MLRFRNRWMTEFSLNNLVENSEVDLNITLSEEADEVLKK